MKENYEKNKTVFGIENSFLGQDKNGERFVGIPFPLNLNYMTILDDLLLEKQPKKKYPELDFTGEWRSEKEDNKKTILKFFYQ